jgi:rubrerythrin
MQRSLRIPVLGQLTQQQLRETLFKSIVDEATAADFYTRLLPLAPDETAKDFIEHARDDELYHLQHFENLYARYYGTRPQFNIRPIQFADYAQGLMAALRSEMDAAGFYRDVQLSTRDPLVRDTFYLAMVDELEHAIMFSTLLNRH